MVVFSSVGSLDFQPRVHAIRDVAGLLDNLRVCAEEGDSSAVSSEGMQEVLK